MKDETEDKVPFWCGIGLHSWEQIRDPEGAVKVGHWSPGPAGIDFMRVHNRVCTACPKKDMAADRIREGLDQKEKLAQQVYNEKEDMSKKYITLKFPANDWKAVRWVINCFQASVHDSYELGAPSRKEADQLTEGLHEQARKQVNALSDEVRFEPHYDT